MPDMPETKCGKCYNCGKYRPTTDFYLLHRAEPDYSWNLCSLDCLMEHLWVLRGEQPKLSKSRMGEQS